MNILDDLKQRGLVYQTSDEKALAARLVKGPLTLYVGFDPTADSLHVGNLLQILALVRFQRAGHTPIALVGGATGLIGDPSGKSEERQLNPKEVVEEWNGLIRSQLERFLDFDAKDNPAKVVNNYDWLGIVNYLDFLRDIGKHFNINDMIDKETVKKRLKVGISLTEFNYMVLQAYDFLQLNEQHGCELQVGGSDQWGNIISGVELLRKKESRQVFALTQPLITKSDGTKFGKSEGGAVWLDAAKTSPYQLYQFWLNMADKDTEAMLKYFTFLPLEEIEDLAKEMQINAQERPAQKKLAQEVTRLVHGQAAVDRAEKITEVLFGGSVKELSEIGLKEAFSGAPSMQLDKIDLSLVDLLIETGLSSSKRQAREDIEVGAININGEVIKDLEAKVGKDSLLFGKYLVLRRGKKNYHLVSVK